MPEPSAFEKLAHYFRAAAALRSPNLRGLPGLPRCASHFIPYSRFAYNTFVHWIDRLQLGDATTVFDVGANHGDFAAAASAAFPAAEVFLSEPVPALHAELADMSKRRKSVWHVLPFALGSRAGHFPLYLDAGDDAIGSLAGFPEEYARANPVATTTREIQCEVQTLDDVAMANGVRRIDLLKIDVEGFEFEVLKGAAETLPAVRALIVEVSLVRHSRGATNPLVAMLDFLVGAGFEIVEIIPSLFDSAETWKPAEFNVLFRKSTESFNAASRE